MSEFITKSELKSFAPYKTMVLAENSKDASRASISQIPAVFLSHSRNDKIYIEHAIRFLRSQGVDVYVDWLDEEMPEVVSGETANKLREKIRKYRKFVLLSTDNSKDSKWVPWELGFADGQHNLDHIAVLPVANDDRTFKGAEYIQIYPKIEKYNGRWIVWTSAPPRITELSAWLKS